MHSTHTWNKPRIFSNRLLSWERYLRCKMQQDEVLFLRSITVSLLRVQQQRWWWYCWQRWRSSANSVQNSKICLSKHHTLTEQVGRMCRWSLYSLKELIVLQLPWVAFLLWMITLSKIQRSSFRDILWADLFCNDYSNSTAHYQPLDTSTTDYTSVYTTPTGRRGPPSVEVEGKMYSIVDPIKRDTDTTYDTTKKEEPYYIWYYDERAILHVTFYLDYLPSDKRLKHTQ